MSKLFENIKEFTYDAIGYILPGIVTMYFVIIVIYNHQSPMYVFFTDFKKYKETLTVVTKMNFMFVIIASYIIGHLMSGLVSIIKCILKNFNNDADEDKEEKTYIQILEKVALEKYKDDDVLKLIKLKEEKIKYIMTKASTLSRFENHSDLIQKYIYKSKLYSSLSFIFLVLFIDSLISTIVKLSILKLYNIAVIAGLGVLTYSLYLEYEKHAHLRLKESYMYLLKKENKEKSID